MMLSETPSFEFKYSFFIGRIYLHQMGPFHDLVTWYKIGYAGWQMTLT